MKERPGSHEAHFHYSTRQLLKRMLGFLRPVRLTAAVACAILIARVGIEVLSVYFLSPAITTLAKKVTRAPDGGLMNWLLGPSAQAHDLRRILILMAITQVTLALFTYLKSIWETKLSMEAVYHIRSRVYDKLQNLGFTFHDKMTTGQLINRALGDLQAVRMFVNASVLSTLDVVISLAAYMGLLFSRSPWLMLASLIPLPFWYIILTRFSQKAQPVYKAQQEGSDQLTVRLTENLYGAHVVRAFGRERQEIRKYQNASRSLLGEMYLMITLQSQLTPALKIIGTLSHVGLFLISAFLISQGKISVGDIMILGIAMSTLLSKLQQINMITEVYQKAVVSARRLFEILDSPAATQMVQTKNPLVVGAGEIRFSNVTFGYDPGRPVLKNISCVIPGEKITAIVGPMGAGKSTLAGLISRFYDPQTGQISIDGQTLTQVNLKNLRHAVGYVFQDTFLFSDTVRNNIVYGRKDVSEEMLQAAARAAHADDFIEKLAQGYDTLLGERGVALSGGQRQRLALARALVYDPRILVLDDATAALDATTEQTVYTRLNPLFVGRTVLLIASRLSNVSYADQIIVLENGEITQAGRHEELIERQGHYQSMIEMQLRSEPADSRLRDLAI